jgi:ABC-type nickel/cobalt efflux system permease component RcnA
VAAVPSQAMTESRERARAFVPEMWPSLAIAVIWLVVFAVALFGPDLVSSSAGSFTRVPSAIIVAIFAWLATSVVARYGFRRAEDRSSQSSQSTPASDK